MAEGHARADSGTDMSDSISELAGRRRCWIAAILASIWSGGLALVNLLSLLVVTPDRRLLHAQ